jgi:phosphatidylinositol alpha-1,6-mannosyltransferase
VPTEQPGKLLVVTNDFPPRRGGIESFVFSLCDGLRDEVVVYTARMHGADAVDRRVPYPVVRDRSRMLLPTRRVARRVREVAHEHGCDRVLFGASMPLGLLAGGLRTAGQGRIVGLTHGHEVWWAAVPGARQLLRRVGREVDVLTYVSDYCRDRVAKALRPEDARSMVRLSPGVDPAVFSPTVDGGPLRHRLGIEADQPVVVAASRLVARKGQDVLLEAWPRVLADHPRAVLLVVGGGPARRRLSRATANPALAGSVRMLTDVAWADMPSVYAAGSVFALPCRTRLLGLEPEALGIVFLEAAASGLPIVVGRSGGAPETVQAGATGYVVDPRSAQEVADRICELLADPPAASAMGRRGREWVTTHYSWDTAVDTLRGLLSPDSSD